jgi:hypothetical protein
MMMMVMMLVMMMMIMMMMMMIIDHDERWIALSHHAAVVFPHSIMFCKSLMVITTMWIQRPRE